MFGYVHSEIAVRLRHVRFGTGSKKKNGNKMQKGKFDFHEKLFVSHSEFK